MLHIHQLRTKLLNLVSRKSSKEEGSENMWNNWLILWQISIHNCEGGERSPPPLKHLLFQEPTGTWPHNLTRSWSLGNASFNREEGRRYVWKVRRSTKDVMIQQNKNHNFAYNRTLFIQSQSAQQIAYGLGVRGHHLSSAD